MVKNPSFYCENCGREVPAGLSSCPGCLQEFDSVRCPSCGFTGKAELFKRNCPECGFFGEEVIDKTPDSNSSKVKTSGKDLPSWLYKVFIGTLVIVIIYLIKIYFLL